MSSGGPTTRMYSVTETQMKAPRSMFQGKLSPIIGPGSSAPSAVPGSDRIGAAAQHPLANAPCALAGIRAFRNLVKRFALFAEPNLDVLFLFVAAYPQVQRVARFLLPEPAFRPARRLAIVPTHNLVAHKEPALCRGAVRIHRPNSPRAAGVAFQGEAHYRVTHFQLVHFQAGTRQHLCVRQRLGPAHVFGKEILKGSAAHFLRAQPYVQTVAIELPFLGELPVHGAQHIV